MKKLRLLLTNPCDKHWDDLQPENKGRYCNSCEKHIVDLTQKSDAELVAFFGKKKDNVCGRLLAHQLNRELLVATPKHNWQWLFPIALGAVAFSPAQASQFSPIIEQDIQHSPTSEFQTVPSINSALAPIEIKGKVVHDKSGEPLKGVKIKQRGFQNVLAITDSAGNFTLNIAEGSSNVFSFDLIGYARAEMSVTDGALVKLREQVMMLGGITHISSHSEPLYVVYSGKKSCTLNEAKFKEIAPDWIEDVKVLKGAEASAIYGSKAANGVIVIGIKKAYAKNIDFSKRKK